jgi:hypothetical protein
VPELRQWWVPGRPDGFRSREVGENMPGAEQAGRSSDRPWSPEEKAVIARAVDHAPSVHNTQPWSLRFEGRAVELHERHDSELSRHDPEGRDRRLSCGAALANLVLAVRNAGWIAETSLGNAGERGAAVATVTGTRKEGPSDSEHRRFQAIPQRTSHRWPFDASPVTGDDREAVRGAAAAAQSRWIAGRDEALELARQLTYAARVHHGDEAYQRELSSWTVPPGSSSTGVPDDALSSRGLGAVGLVSASTRVPDEEWLAGRIADESVLLVSTPADGPHDQVCAGEALELAWLEATSRGLAVSVMTQALRLAEVRSGLGQLLGTTGVPQALMRLGRPATSPSFSARRPLDDAATD